MLTIAVLAIGIFTAFILYDLKRVRDGEETNYITATLGIYLSLYNVFQSLLALLGIFGGGPRLGLRDPRDFLRNHFAQPIN